MIGVLIFTCDEKHCWKVQKLEFVHPRIVPQIGKWRHDHFLISTMFGNIIEGVTRDTVQMEEARVRSNHRLVVHVVVQGFVSFG